MDLQNVIIALRKSNMLLIVSLCFGIVQLCSCSQSNTCIEPQTVALRGGFYYKDTTAFIDTILINANIIYGAQTRVGLNLKSSNKIGMTLSPIDDQITMLFQSDSTSIEPNTLDTIQIKYSRSLHFISSACGFETYYELKTTSSSHHILDTVLIANAAITNDINKEHIKLVIKK